MACLSGENQVTVFIRAPHPSYLSIAHGFENDAMKKGEDKKVLGNQTAIVLRTPRLHGSKQDVMKKGEDKKLLGNQTAIVHRTARPHGSKEDVTKKGEDKKVLENQTTIVLRTAPLSITHGLKQDVMTKEEDRKVLENLKKELEAKYRKAYMVRLFWIETNFETEKISFTRAMEKAWLMNSIIKEKCLILCHSGEGNHQKEIEKVMEFNKKIKRVICLGLDGLIFGVSNKRKCCLYQDYDQVEEELEELENLMKCNREIVPSPEDREKFGNDCKKTCRRAHPFTKLESREEYLKYVTDSVRERETERERETFGQTEPTENEILSYMLLQEITNSSLHNTSRVLLDSITLSSGAAGENERDKIIHVHFNEILYMEHANAKSNFETSLASRYDAFVMNAKSDCNNSNNELEQIKQMLGMVEELAWEVNERLIMGKKYHNVSALERQYERKLFKFCEDLSYYMRLGRCLNPLSETEKDRLKQIGCLVRDVIHKYTKANGADSLPAITQPHLPTWRNY